MTNRIMVISRMRVLAMTMIVLFHSLLFYAGTWWHFPGIIVPTWVKTANFLDSLDLAMFVFISGYLFGHLYIYKNKYTDRKAFISNKFKRLLIPYLFWGIAMICVQPSIHDWNSMLTGISHLWFLLMLFWVFCAASIIAPFIKKHSSAMAFISIIICAYTLWLTFHLFSTHHYLLCLEKSLSYFLPFYIGFYAAQRKMLNHTTWKVVVWSIATIIMLFVYIFFIVPFDDIYNNLVIRILSYISIIGIFISLNKLPDSPMDKYILVLDKLSMGIYIFNQIVINAVLLIPSINSRLITNYKIGPLIIFIVSFTIPAFLSYIFNKSKYLSWTIGG